MEVSFQGYLVISDNGIGIEVEEVIEVGEIFLNFQDSAPGREVALEF